MDYTETIDKALSWLRELELDKALTLFYQLLEEHPKDLELIQRIYPLEIKRPNSSGYQKICQHIFSIQSNKPELQSLIVNTYCDYSKLRQEPPPLNKTQLFNLFIQLGNSHLLDETERLRDRIKKEFADDKITPEILQLGCEQLIRQNKLIQVRDELKYIIAYYAETESGRWALNMRKQIEAQIIR
ncbi:hypothetical protein [Aliikangiella coralliicola]|uniref:Tetratricopeptide repeat protein n=1 Tax=Aliikangiella coralliicola TaxID=2592383 RepID=A0A545UAU0_9GAMM|nr:hypothetical protein [Aliikangiella coralliicola]TQV86584.1 hypothetical protein FLL46_16935 [Aliikangiella coralliicola]